MAKTTSQILAENIRKREEEAAIAASRNAIHKQQMAGVEEKANARTAAVLQKAAANAQDSATKSEMENALKRLTTAKLAATPAVQETVPIDTAVSNEPKKDVPLGSAYLTGKQAGVSSPYAAGLQAQQQKLTPEQEAEKARQAAEAYRKQQEQLQADEALRQNDMEEFQNWSSEDQAALQKYIMDRDRLKWNWMNGPTFENAEYNARALIEKYGLNRVKEMAESYSRTENQKNAEKVTQMAQEGAGKSGWAAAGHSLASLGASFVGATTGTFGYLNEATNSTKRYSTMDPNNVGNIFSTYSGAVRNEVAENIAGDEYDENGQQVKEGGKLREMASLGYQGIMSAGDSAMRILGSGGNAGISAALAASGTFSQTMSEASRQGAAPEQAAALAVTKAGIEYLTEKLPTDKLLDLFHGKNTAGKVGSILAQAFLVEPTSEEASLFLGVAAETQILGEKSNKNLRIGEMVANGMSHEDAEKQFYTELWNEAAATYVTSAFSGGLSATGAAVLGGRNTAEQLLDGIQDRTPAPAPLTEEQQHFDNAAAIANGMEPEVQKNAVSEETAMQIPEQLPKETNAKPVPMSMEDFANNDSPVWRNVEYHDDATKNSITQDTHKQMVDSGAVVKVSDDIMQTTEQSFPDLRGMKKQDRTPILKASISSLKNNLRQFLGKFSGQAFEFEVNGKVLEAKLYSTGINEVLEKVTKDKASMLYSSKEIFQNARYLYSTPDYDGNSNVYRWNYFYTPVQIGEDTVGVRIAVRDMVTPQESQIYNWGIKKDAPLGGVEHTPNGRTSHGASSDASGNIIPGNAAEVNGKIDSTQQADTDSGVQMAASNEAEESPEGGQDTAGTVGAMQSQFRHEVKQSRVYGNTYKNTPYADIHDIGRAAKNEDPNIDQYDVITEAESLHEAELRTQTGRDRLVEHNALMKKAGWTGADNDTAMKLLTAYRKEGKRDRFLELSRKQRQMGTQAGQMVQSFAKYSREDATVAVQDAIADLDELTIDQVDKTFWKPKQEAKGAEGKQDAFQKWKETITGSLLEVANDIENVKDGDKDAMKDLVRQIANLRHTTGWMGYSSDLTRRTERGLDKMDFDTLKSVAKTQLSMIPNDFRKRDNGEIMKQIRVQNMLFTLTTKFKNDSGNITNGLMDAVSDSFGGRMIDAILSTFTGQRTVGNDLKFAKEYSKAARDAADVAAAFVSLDIPMEMDTKYSSGTRTWSPNTTNVLARMMSAYEKHMKYALEVSDKFYEGGAAHVVNRSLQDLGEKSNLTPEQIQDIAQKTGQRRTFKDPGASVSKDGQPKKGRMFARANVGLQRGLNQIGTENIGLGDLVMPFAAVSGEVKQVGMDYTGGGLISGLNEIISIAKDARNGKQIDPYRQRMAATDFGRGMTGVGLIVAFTALASSGAIKVHNDRDSEERMMNQTQGLSGAQWNLNASVRWWEAITAGATAEEAAKASKWQSGDELITIDFLEPFNTQMHIGYLLSQGKDVLTAIAQGNFDSLLEMPMMQTLSDLADLQQAFTEVSDGDMGGVYDAAGQLVGTVAGSAVPNWARKTAQIIDPYYRDTYDTNPFKKAGKDVLAAVPFASRNLPQKYDNLGKEQRRYEDGEWMAAAFDNLVTPWDTDTYQTNEAYQEIQRLNAIEGVDVTPPGASRKITYTDKNGVDHKGYALTDAQYETMQKVQGQTAAKVIADMISSKDYAALTDEQKAEAIKMAYSYAKETAEIAAVENHLGYSASWMMGIQDREARTIIAKTVSSSLDDATGGLQEAWKNGWDVGTQGDDLKWAYDTFSQLGKIAKDKVESSLDGMTADYVEARGEGISHEAFLDAAKLLEGIKPQAGFANPRDVQKAEAIAGMKGVSQADKTLLIKQQMSESQNENLDQMLDLGYSPEEYAGVLRIYRDIYDSDSKTKKDDFIKKLMDRYGMTKAEANAVYQIYK